MAFTGKATYSAGSGLPEIAEDVSDIIGIVSPYETPLLDHLGDPQRQATSTVHEWLEDELLPNQDELAAGLDDSETSVSVSDGERFRAGDQVQVEGNREVMLVTGVSGDTLTVSRGYGGTASESASSGQMVRILGNAAFEGADAPEARFTNRKRKRNYTQIFTSAVEVSGSQLAVQTIGVDDELDYQKQERLRELVRDVENCVINGVAAEEDAQGDASVRRTMNGILPMLGTNVFEPGVDDFPSDASLSEGQLNQALRSVWEQSHGGVDTIVVGGYQKRRINSFIASSRGYEAESTTFRDMVSVYESDFGVCRVVLSRWMPRDAVLLLDSSRVDVMPLSGRSFHFKKLASKGDREAGQVIGEYTLEMRNESAHGVIRGLTAA